MVLVFLGCGAVKSYAPHSTAAGKSDGYYGDNDGTAQGGSGYYRGDMPMKASTQSFAAPPPAPASSFDMIEEEMMVEADFRDTDSFMDGDSTILAAEKDVPASAGAASGEGSGSEPAVSDMPDAVVEGRVIIYEARIGLAVFQVQEELEKIRKKIKQWDGYMLAMNAYSITFRIPVEKFDEVVDEVSSMGELISKDITGQDVTDEFRDLTIKLKNALVMRDRLIELLGKANTVKESLLIEAELKRLLEEIELIKGRLKFLKESALYSKITVYLESKETYKKPIPKLPVPLQWIQYELGLNGLFEQ